MDPFLGEVRTFAFGFEPQWWVHCDGRILSIGENTALFSLLGTTYGGDGRTTFAIPDMAPHPTNVEGATLGHFIAVNGIYPPRPPAD